MSKIEQDRPDWHRGNTFVTLGQASANVISAAQIVSRTRVGETTAGGDLPITTQEAVRRGLKGSDVVGIVVGSQSTAGETTGQCDQAGDSPIVFDVKAVRRLEQELARVKLVAAQALADVAAARTALELSIKHQDAQHNEAMARMKVRHDAKVAELDDMIVTLVGKLTQSSKGHDAVRPVAASLDAIEWNWNPLAGLPRGMR